jgi:tyrosyl-tRNA synthetase
MKVKTDKQIIDRILTKGIEQILPSEDALRELLESGKRIKIYQGFDPTADTLHIGHTVGMRKLEDFRKLGHHVIFLIGDFTARVGDPSDKTAARQMLTKEQVEENLKKYKEQASKIIDIDNKENPVEILYNSEWLEKLDFGDIIDLTSKFTVQQMIKRDMFQKRLENNKPIYINEFLYPVMQGYDCVVMDVDVEVGGNDQLFNMLAGRDLIMSELGKEKIVLAAKLLATADGSKMGKSEGNMIRMDDKPKDIFGKVMAFTDQMIIPGFEILTFVTMDEVQEYKERLESGENPMTLKKELAFKITSEITSEEKAKGAQKYFESVFQKKDKDVEIPVKEISQEEIALNDLLVEIGFAKSKSQAKRLAQQGAVKIDGEKITEYNHILNVKASKPIQIRAGKKLCQITYKS